MPSSSVPLIELHFAKTLEDLKKKAEIAQKEKDALKKRDAKGLVSLSEKFLLEAKDNLRKGDQERAYFYFFRIFSIQELITKENQKEYSKVMTLEKLKYVMNELTNLQDNLSHRYDNKNKIHEERRATFFTSTSSSFPGTSVKVDTSKNITPLLTNEEDADEQDDIYPTTTPPELMQFINNSTQIVKILIIDVRSTDEFAQSSINKSKISTKCDLEIINVPSQIFSPSMTYSQLSKKISLGKPVYELERRRSMDRIVIMDKQTHSFENDSNCVLLAMALNKWDHSPERIKKKPYLLKGGYVDFVFAYPMHVTNSDVILNGAQSLPSPQPKPARKGLYDFDQENNAEEERKEIKHKHTNKEVTDKTATTLNGFITPLNNGSSASSLSVNNRSTTIGAFGSSVKVPGIAKPVIPDRSSKPKLDSFTHNNLCDQNDINFKDEETDSGDDMSAPSFILHDKLNNRTINKKPIIDRSEFPPKPGHLLSPSNVSNGQSSKQTNGMNGFTSLTENGDKKMDISDDEDLPAGNFDDDLTGDRVPPSPSVLQTPVHRRNEAKFTIDDNMSDDDDVEERPTLTSRSKPISVNRPNGTTNYSAPSSLSRSLSSPNIAQFDQESQEFSFNSVGTGTPKFGQPLPHIDRSVKPLPYQALLRKPRDFNPQFSSTARITGLRNLGNTCFMNSILQCLNNTSELSESLRMGNVHINPESKFGSNGELTIELMELLKQMVYPSNYKHISPRDLKTAVTRHIPDFVDYKQQDAHEFLVRFLDRLHADLNTRANVQANDPTSKDANYYDKLPITTAANSFWNLHLQRNKSIITDLFEGLIVSTLTCLHCRYTSKALEAFTCLTLPVQEGGRTSIATSLKMFLKCERITDEAAWQCPTCKQKRDAEKCTYIWKLPKILVIHLKRFSYDGMWRQKINTFVDFPIDNLLIEARDGNVNQSYNLYGVVNHSGSLEGGHYIAYSRNLEHNITWHKYDDQDVSPVSAGEVITQNAYVLFYKQTKTSSV